MKKIVVYISPFMKEQKIQIFDDKELYFTCMSDLENISDKVVALAYNNNIKDVIITGGAAFTQRFQEQILEQSITKYSHQLNVELYN